MQQLQPQMQAIRADDELALKEIMELSSKSKEITRTPSERITARALPIWMSTSRGWSTTPPSFASWAAC